MNFCQVGIACTVLYYSVTTFKFSQMYRLGDFIRTWPVLANMCLTCIVIVLTFVQWRGIYKDNTDMCRVTGSVQTVAFALIFLFGCFIAYDSSKYDDRF